MMTTQPYYGAGGEYEPFHRPSSHRSLSSGTGTYYERPAPYSYYEQPRQDFRSELVIRPTTRIIHEPESDAVHIPARRRIAVACARCRRRKIKCSGDPGDASGCQACRASGTDIHQCTFTRVGSTDLPIAGLDTYPATSASSQSGSYAGSASGDWQHPQHAPLHRPSLPTISSRSPFFDSYDQYENSSPVDAYTYASSTIPRQNSFSSSYSAGSVDTYRPWSTSSGPVAVPVTAGYYEQNPSYGFGGLHVSSVSQYPQATSTRLPSVTAEPLSPLNMGHLHSSLPTHTVQERRLPAPYTAQYHPSSYPGEQLPEIRPLSSFSEPRPHIHGIHSRNAMPWSHDNSSSTLQAPSMNTIGPPVGLPLSSAHNHLTSGVGSDPPLGYQISHTPVSDSPETSPASGVAPDVRNTISENNGEESSGNVHQSQVAARQSQTQNVAVGPSSIDALRRQSSFSHQRSAGAASTSDSRMSVSALNGGY